MSAKRKAIAANEAAKNENPLISNRTLRQIYTKLAELRAFDEYSAKMPRRAKDAPRPPSIRGQEAARVSTLIDLKPGDLISDAGLHPATGLVLGAKLHHLLKPKSSRRHSSAHTEKTAKQLPPIADANERLQLAMGAALALKTARQDNQQGNIVVVFVAHRELAANAWKKLLHVAAQLELPIIFVVLPAGPKKNASITTASDQAHLARIPGIPVDSADPVALYRVMQESLGRTRGGDGPVVIDSVNYTLPGRPLAENDAIVQMGRFLLERKVCTKAELDAIHKKSQRRLKPSRH